MNDLLGRRLKAKTEESYSQGVVRKLGIRSIEFEEKILYRPDVMERTRLRDIKDIFYDVKAVRDRDDSEAIYKSYLRQNKGLSYRMVVVNPGKIGDEFYKTRGHFHRNAADTEIYLTLRGNGLLLLQHKRTNRCMFVPLKVGNVANVPPYYAHRVVNIGNEELTILSIFPRTSGSDYKTIREKGDFKYLIVEEGGKAEYKRNSDFRA